MIGDLVGAMTVAVVVVGAAVGGIHVASWAIVPRDRLHHMLVATVAGFGVIVLCAQALGALGALGRWSLTLLVVAVAVATRRLPIRISGAEPPAPEPPSRRTALDHVAVGASALTTLIGLGLWLTRTGRAVARGITEFDSVHYHMVHAAHMAQSGSAFTLNVVDPALPLQFHPATIELLHASSMVLSGSDVLSPVLNLLWLGVAVLGAAALTRHSSWPRRAIPVGAVMALASTPVVVRLQAGSAHSDMAVVALVIAAVALLLHGPADVRGAMMVGLAAGLAAGSKFTGLVPAAALGVAVAVLAPAGLRLRATTSMVATAMAVGGGWYLRNLLATGNPVPSVDVGILPVVEYPLLDETGLSVAHYLGSAEVWSAVFLPGLGVAFGDAWPVLFALAAVGLAAALWQGSPGPRMAGLIGVLAAAAYLVTPWTALGPPGDPIITTFIANLRYLLPALALGVLLVTRRPVGSAWRATVAASLAVVAALSAVEMRADLVAIMRTPRQVLAVAGLVTVLGVLVAVTAAARRWGPPSGAWPVVAAGVLLATGVTATAQVRHDRPFGGPGVEDVWSWSRQLQDQRIGHAGFPIPYALYGVDLDNEVRALVASDGAAPRAIASCEEAVRAANEVDHVVLGSYEQFVLVPSDGPLPPPRREIRSWLIDAAGVDTVIDGRVTVLTRTAPLDATVVCRTGAGGGPPTG